MPIYLLLSPIFSKAPHIFCACQKTGHWPIDSRDSHHEEGCGTAPKGISLTNGKNFPNARVFSFQRLKLEDETKRNTKHL